MADAAFSIAPPVEPMLARLAEALPEDGPFLYEPKWDGFRAIVFRRDAALYIQSRDLRPLDRYFPELHDALPAGLPSDCVVDGEIVIATPNGLDFDALQLRLHPAASRVAKLAKACPSSFVAFDLLAIDGEDLRERSQTDAEGAEDAEAEVRVSASCRQGNPKVTIVFVATIATYCRPFTR